MDKLLAMDQLLAYINPYFLVSEDEYDRLLQSFTIKKLQPNELFFEQGMISDEIYFVLNGCIRLFYIADIEDKTAFFYMRGKFICAGESYNLGIPARENYQSMGESEIIIFKKKKIDHLLRQHPKFEIIGRIATEEELIASQRIIESFVTKTAEERYIELLNTNKELFQNVPQHYIATFLGVSPETLSRIKRRTLKKSFIDNRQVQ